MSIYAVKAVCGCLLLLVVGQGYSLGLPHGVNLDPEVNYNSLQLITTKGYPGEEHWITTVDGYILALHRIPAGRNQSKGPRPVFFLQHGLLGSSSDWIINLANESLAFILADHGYDVWMGNVRGNTYSRNHTTLKVDSREFWNFSFDEHAQKDLPAMLDYVLTVTGKAKLFYVGHSQGTIMAFAGFTFNQSLAQHIQAFFALAPVTTVEYIQGAFRILADYSTVIYNILNKVTYGEFIPNDPLINFFAKYVCTADMKGEGLCSNVVFLITGYDKDNLNASRLPVYVTHTPAGTSLKNVNHLAQEVHSGRFAMYDYGDRQANIRQYGVSPSPAYDVSAMNVPMALFTGGKDWIANPTDVANLLPILNGTGHLIFHKDVSYYNHLDFIWGLDAPVVIYKEILSLAHTMVSSTSASFINSASYTNSSFWCVLLSVNFVALLHQFMFV